jgi:alkylation response protein AidB-like acyl-CoA dehydrogenase
LRLGSPELAAVLADVGAGAAERERLDEAPFEQVAALMRAGLGAVSLPVDQGGQGASVRDLLAFVIELAAADPIIAHALRTHYHQVFTLLRLADSDARSQWLDQVRAGALFGNAISETGTAAAGNHEFATTLTDVDGRLMLDGTKYYSTGTLYADYIAVAARMADDQVATIVVPTDRNGVAVIDDWDSMGQRRTGTGTTTFTSVRVERHEILARRPRLAARHPGDVPFLQLYLHAVIAGILRSVVTDAAVLVRGRHRSFDHAPTPRPVDDPILHEQIGELAATAWMAKATVLAAAERVEAAMRDGQSDQSAAKAGAAASLATSAVKIHLDRVAVEAASALFGLGGASASSRERNLDRHWRNIRTITLHNPASYKAVALGRSVVTGEPLPRNAYF